MLAGELLAIASGICFSLHTMLAQRGMQEASVPAGVTVVIICNNITYALLLSWQVLWQGMPALNTTGVLYAAGGGLFGNVLGRTLNYSAVRRIGSARAVSLSLTQTLFAFIFSVFLLKEAPDARSLAGIVLMVGGVYWLSRDQVKRKAAHASDDSAATIMGFKEMALLGIIFALLSGMAYSGADLSRKLSMRFLPSAVLSSAIGGFSALVVQSTTFSLRRGWVELKGLSRKSFLFLIAAGTVGGLAIVLLNSAFSFSSMVIVNALYNIRVWVPIVLGPALLGTEAQVNKAVVGSTFLILSGTMLIILR